MNNNFRSTIKDEILESYLINLYNEIADLYANVCFLHTYCDKFATLEGVYYIVPFTSDLGNHIKNVAFILQKILGENICNIEANKIFRIDDYIKDDSLGTLKKSKRLYNTLLNLHEKIDNIYANIGFLNNYCEAYSHLEGVYYFTPFTRLLKESITEIEQSLSEIIF